MHKFYIGPMSKEIVDVILNQDDTKFAFIPSRRQVEFNGGYVNNWSTKTFAEYVKSKNQNFIICRDHAGANQGQFKDDGFESLTYDAQFFDMIHIDPWKFTKVIEDGIKLTVDYIEFANKLNKNLRFEIATEESIFSFDPVTLDYFVDNVRKKLGDKFETISHLVIQSGTKLLGNNQIGDYSKDKLIEQIKVSKKYDLISKEHNGDYIDPYIIKEKFEFGLDCINIAPEFGYLQTCAILDNISQEKKELFFNLCYASNRWKNWVNENFDPYQNKEELIKICGHYVFSNDKFKEEIYDDSFETIINSTLNKKIGELNDIV